MHAAADRLEFAPPPQPGLGRALALALGVHVLLMLALTWGVNWKRDADNLTAEAELWSALPQQAAPRLVEAPPQPAPRVEAPPPAPAPEVDIAVEREKARRKAEAIERREAERQKQVEARRREQELQQERAELKAAQERKRQEELAKAKAADAQAERRMAAQREENLRRMQGLAGATGAPTSTGTAPQSTGMSDSYAGRVRARVRPNIVFTDEVSGNPSAEVEVRMAPDGTITSSKIVKRSGVKSWDDAVLRALDKTEVLPRDIDGRVHTPLIIEFRPRS